MLGLFGRLSGASGGRGGGVRADSGEGVWIGDLTSPEAEAFLRGGGVATSGAVVTDRSAMRVAAAWRCIHILAGAIANLPIDLYREPKPKEKEVAANHPLRPLLKYRPNDWQASPSFRRLLTAWTILRGNGYALKVKSRGRVIALWPIHPDHMQPKQLPDRTVVYNYTSPTGGQLTLAQDEVFHLRGLSLDGGVTGLGVLQAAREALGLALQTEQAGARLFRQGVLAGGTLEHPNTLGGEAYDRLKQSIEERNAGVENAHKWLILEEGMKAGAAVMSAADAQFLETRKFERSEIAMFFGVPPFLIGDTEKTTSWGSGIEQMGTGFVQYTLQDWITAWEEAIELQLLGRGAANDDGTYVLLDPRGLMRGDSTGRANFYARALGAGGSQAWMVPDEVRALEDLNPIPGGDKLPQPGGPIPPDDKPTPPPAKDEQHAKP